MLKTGLESNKFFTPDFERIYLNQDGSFSYVIDAELSLIFDRVSFIEEGVRSMPLKDVIYDLNIIEDARRIIERRLRMFTPYKEDRIERFLSGETRNVFFDAEQCFKLKEIFSDIVFSTEGDVLLNGALCEIKKLSPAQRSKLVSTMHALGLSYELTPEEFIGFKTTKRVKVIAKRSEYEKGKGTKHMSKSSLMLKAVGGGLILAVGAIASIAGVNIISKATSLLLGLEKEVILIEEDEE